MTAPATVSGERTCDIHCPAGVGRCRQAQTRESGDLPSSPKQDRRAGCLGEDAAMTRQKPGPGRSSGLTAGCPPGVPAYVRFARRSRSDAPRGVWWRARPAHPAAAAGTASARPAAAVSTAPARPAAAAGTAPALPAAAVSTASACPAAVGTAPAYPAETVTPPAGFARS